VSTSTPAPGIIHGGNSIATQAPTVAVSPMLSLDREVAQPTQWVSLRPMTDPTMPTRKTILVAETASVPVTMA